MSIEPHSRVLITGAASGLGLALVKQFVERGCRTFTPMMKQQSSGHIVNTASAAGLIHPPRMSEYNAVKAGVVALSETLLHELKPFDVNVSVICPTFFKTNLTDSLRGKDEAAQQSAAKLIDKDTVTADDMAAEVIKGVEKNKPIILTDRNGRVAYAANRFARPVYDQMMSKVSRQMAAKD